MGIISQHLDAAGWAAVLLVAFGASCTMVVLWLLYDMRSNARHYRDVLFHPPYRLMAGTALIFTGALVRLVTAFPANIMIEAGAWPWVMWWGEVSAYMLNAGSVLIIAGLVTMMWPALYERFGRWVLPVIVTSACLVYAAGVAVVIVAARLL